MKGFSVVEFLIVVMIILIIAALAIPNFYHPTGLPEGTMHGQVKRLEVLPNKEGTILVFQEYDSMRVSSFRICWEDDGDILPLWAGWGGYLSTLIGGSMKVNELLEFLDKACGTNPQKTIHTDQYADECFVWDILSALRGPDDGDYLLKMATTCVIRWAIFPRLRTVKGEGAGHGFMTAADNEYSRDFRVKALQAMSTSGVHRNEHFLNHARLAFDRLGLKWDEVNVIGQATPVSPQSDSSPNTSS